MANHIFQTMMKDDLPITKLCTLVRDGPNVNKTIVKKLEGAMKNDNSDFGGFIDLGSCVLHNVHNAFGKGLEDMGKTLNSFVWTFTPFSSTAQRDEKLSHFTICNGCGDAQFPKAYRGEMA